MSSKTGNGIGSLSRRLLLEAAAGAAGAAAAAALSLPQAAAAPKISKAAVAYQDHPDGDKRCGKCMQFQPPGSCKLVDGPIDPQGYCSIFAALRQAARPARPAGTVG